MLITDTVAMMKRAKDASGVTWREVRSKLGNKKTNYISIAHAGHAMIKTYVDILDALGYDIGLYLFKKNNKGEENNEKN